MFNMTYLKVFGLAVTAEGKPDWAGMTINAPEAIAKEIVQTLLHKAPDEIVVITKAEYNRDYYDENDIDFWDGCEEDDND